ncbi:MAG: hypothetical protein L0Z62_16015 [Gemmataceae bacterium]|nr:hypothetical protein [Gemmataceae bacterium]
MSTCTEANQALQLTAGCRREGLFVIPIFYPAVPMNAPRIRARVIAAHSDADIDESLDILGRVGREVGLIP